MRSQNSWWAGGVSRVCGKQRMLLTNKDFFQSVNANRTQTSDGLLSSWWEQSWRLLLFSLTLTYLKELIICTDSTQTPAASHMPVDWAQCFEQSEIMKRCLWTNHWICYQLFFLSFIQFVNSHAALIQMDLLGYFKELYASVWQNNLPWKFSDKLVDSMSIALCKTLKKETISTNVFLWHTMCTKDFQFMQMIKCCDRLLPVFWLIKHHVILVGL